MVHWIISKCSEIFCCSLSFIKTLATFCHSLDFFKMQGKLLHFAYSYNMFEYQRAAVVFEQISYMNQNGRHRFREFNDMCSYGFNVYNNVWKPVIGKELRCQREKDNPRDPYAVAVTKSCTGDVGVEVVGHVPHYLSALCSLFTRQSGVV